MTWRLLVVVPASIVGFLLVSPIVIAVLLANGVVRLTRTIASVIGTRKEAAPWRELVEYEPVIGWRPKPNLDVYAEADDVFQLTTGPDGWRGMVSVANADVVVFGDSYAFGHGASDDEMYTKFCGDLRVKPIGSDGYNMVHGLLWMKRLAPKLTGKLVVWFIYYGNDLHENLLPNNGKYRMPFVRHRRDGEGWELVTEHVSKEPWPFDSPSSYHRIMAKFSTPTPFSRRVFSACEFLISEAHETCRKAGTKLAIVGIPDRIQLTRRGQARLRNLAPADDFDIELPDQELGRISGRFDIPFVSLREHLTSRDYLIHDIHWRRSGHRKAGQILWKLYSEESWWMEFNPNRSESSDDRVDLRV